MLRERIEVEVARTVASGPVLDGSQPTGYIRGMYNNSSMPTSAVALVEASGPQGPDIKVLRDRCPDPMQLFVLSPILLRVRQLAEMYADDVSDVPGAMTTIRRRMSEERWNEMRASFQMTRFEKQRDAIADVEATALAVMAVDFRLRRVNDAMGRWQNLATHVEEQLARCASGERPFTPDLRDACRELRELEAALDEVLPHTGANERAANMLTQSRERREDLIIAVGEHLRSIRGADGSRKVLEMIRGGNDG